MAGLVVVMRPYKKIAHNAIDFTILFFLTVIGAPSFIRNVPFRLFLGPIFLPCFFLICCLIFRLLKHYTANIYSVPSQRSNIQEVIPDNKTNSPAGERQPLLKPPTRSVVTVNDNTEDDGYMPIT